MGRAWSEVWLREVAGLAEPDLEGSAAGVTWDDGFGTGDLGKLGENCRERQAIDREGCERAAPRLGFWNGKVRRRQNAEAR
jgi:hypothetical protein